MNNTSSIGEHCAEGIKEGLKNSASKKQPRIISIINCGCILINVGTENGFKVGDLLDVRSAPDASNTITDPFTGEKLGILNTVKDTVKIVDILPKMAICEGTNRITINPFSCFDRPNPRINAAESDMASTIIGDKKVRVGDYLYLKLPQDSTEAKQS